MKNIKFRRAHFDINGNFIGFTYWGFIDEKGNISEDSFSGPTRKTGTTKFVDDQLTGLQDKNQTGIDVYENDLFEFVFSNVPDGFAPLNFKKDQKTRIAVVVFKFGQYAVKVKHPETKDFVYLNLFEFLKNDEKVVIGTAHNWKI
jgi:hypothetical protein